MFRLLEMMLYLSSGMAYSIEEICHRFSISERTAFRYIDTFRNVGFVLEANEHSNYAIDKNSPFFNEIKELIHFSTEELTLLQELVYGLNDQHPMKQVLLSRFTSLQTVLSTAKLNYNRAITQNIHHLKEAIAAQQQVKLLDYRSANSETIKERTVDPFCFSEENDCIWALDCNDLRPKKFKLQRIGQVQLLPSHWQHQLLHKAMLTDAFGMSGHHHIKVKLKLNLRAYQLLCEEHPCACKDTKQSAKGDYTYIGEVQSFEGISRFVMGLLNEVEIAYPTELKQYIHEKIQLYLSTVTCCQ